MHNLFEGLEQNDLKKLIHNELHVDEFKSKLGDDRDVIVLSFKINSKDPAYDLVSFIEKGYEWCIDADVSAGEMDDGDYIVFIELDRNEEAFDHIEGLIKDLENLTGIEPDGWRLRYYKAHDERPFSIEALRELVPATPEAYDAKYGGQEELDKLKTAAGVEVTTKAPKNEFTESLRALAGII